MKRLLLAAVIACMATSASARNNDAKIVPCLIGQATTSLLLQQQQLVNTENKIDARIAANVAYKYASKHCPRGRISEGADDYVYHSIRGKAVEMFGEGEDK
jgi:hypothetical protein